MYHIEYLHEGSWLASGSGITDIEGEFRTREAALACIKACSDTERMEEREMPKCQIIDMRPASIAARTLRAIPSELRAQASRENGKKGGRPKHPTINP